MSNSALRNTAPAGISLAGGSNPFELRQIFADDLIKPDAFAGKLATLLAARKPGDGPLSLSRDMLGFLLLATLAFGPAQCIRAGEPFGLTRRFLDVLMKPAAATGDLSLIAAVLAGVHLRGRRAAAEMLAACWERLESMGYDNTALYNLLNSISGEDVTALRGTIESEEAMIKSLTLSNMSKEGTIKSQEETIKSQEETIKSQEETIKSQEETIKSQEETIKSQEETIKSLSEEHAITRAAGVLGLSNYGKSLGEICKMLEPDLSEVTLILGNRRD
ncbi:MAG: hypothetical protein LBT40_16285 [Deltaproteobacteria bacterium]|nr:hypothetical protein [Deltaproteobacteria bacterium]